MIPIDPAFISTLDRAIDLTPGQKFLHLNLNKDLAALLKVEDIAEVLQIPQSGILPIPQMPPCVLGIHNWRGEMLWAIALNNLLGLASIDRLDPSSVSTMALVVTVIDNQYLGLVVDRVNDIEWHELELIQSPKAQLFPAQLLQFMQGYLSDSGTIILDPQAIARSPKIRQLA